jgi:hypothetical protein
MGAGGAALLATLFSRNEARAGHDGTNVMHLGESNNTPAGASTAVGANTEIFAFRVHNENLGGGGGILADSKGHEAAMKGHAFDPSPTGVFGASFSSTGGPGTGVGVAGASAGGIGVSGGAVTGRGVAGQSESGTGLAGRSETGTGVDGHSDTGAGGRFSSPSGQALSVLGRASMTAGVAAAFGDTLFVENQQAGAGGGGAISAVAHGDAHSVEGVANGMGVGVSGVAGGDPFGEGAGDGVHGISGTGTGVDGNSGSGIGVRARSTDGIALAVEGTSRFSTAGFAAIPAGDDSAFVPNSAVTDVSHISVTFASDPGSRQVIWVQGSPGSGFTVRTSSQTKKTPETHFTYLIVEPE